MSRGPNWANMCSLPLDMCAPCPTADQKRRATHRHGVWTRSGANRHVDAKVYDHLPLARALDPREFEFLRRHPHHLLP
jgi:hypothetical protein